MLDLLCRLEIDLGFHSTLIFDGQAPAFNLSFSHVQDVSWSMVQRSICLDLVNRVPIIQTFNLKLVAQPIKKLPLMS
jgi:hypothetical protein